jgi:16S rRNA (cytosine967-C5)-methyltransferase
MAFRTVSEDCLALPAGSKIEQAVALNYEAVIQDLNSQRTAEFFKPAIYSSPMPLISAWDCCAGSGGKSIMLYDLHKQLDLTVSDVRESIISNLKRRFQEAEINNYHSIVADVAASSLKLPARSKFDLVICDAPCTGSGTWSRTPEQAYYFDVNKIEEYGSRQKRIVANTIPHLGPGSHFIYITCSVFKKENEEVADFIQQKFQLEMIRAEVLKGYNKKADTMFAALFRKDGK